MQPGTRERFSSRVILRRSTYAVWEITLKCNLACIHCGSRAGPGRENELSTAEALDLVRQLDEVGIREVSLIGGEAFLRPDWLEIATADTINLRLTPEQLHALVSDVDVVLAKYIDAYKRTPSPGSWPVQIQINAFPLVRGERTADASKTDTSRKEES